MSNFLYDMETVISTFNLKGKSGRPPRLNGVDLTCCCPFPHLKNGKWDYERNPSFGINLATGKFNCFSCGKKGQSLEYLADLLNIRIGYIPKVRIEEVQKIENTVEVTNVYYKAICRNSEKAYEYLLSRGMDIPETVSRFRLGASDNGNNIYFPIMDRDGNLQGWGERLVHGSPKWRNKPYGFVEAGSLYGLYQAIPNTSVCVVESFMDVLRLDSFGYRAVSTLGASISDRQLEMLVDNFNVITALPHNDRPGINWVTRLARELHKRMMVYVAKVPAEYKDVGEISDANVINAIMSNRRLVKVVGGQ